MITWKLECLLRFPLLDSSAGKSLPWFDNTKCTLLKTSSSSLLTTNTSSYAVFVLQNLSSSPISQRPDKPRDILYIFPSKNCLFIELRLFENLNHESAIFMLFCRLLQSFFHRAGREGWGLQFDLGWGDSNIKRSLDKREWSQNILFSAQINKSVRFHLSSSN